MENICKESITSSTSTIPRTIVYNSFWNDIGSFSALYDELEKGLSVLAAFALELLMSQPRMMSFTRSQVRAASIPVRRKIVTPHCLYRSQTNKAW
jgi:hypothetical protein